MSTTTWIHLSLAFSIISVVLHSILLIIESKSFYHRYCWKRTSTNIINANKINNSRRIERVQRGSHDQMPPNTTISTSTSTSSINTKPECKPDKPSRIFSRLHVLPLLMYTSYILSSMIAVLFKLRIGLFSDCAPCGIQGVFYVSGKLLLYLIFIYRLYAIYSDSVFAYNTTHLSIMAVICVLYQFSFCVVNLFTVSSLSVRIGDKVFCDCKTLLFIPVATLLLGTILSVVCCVAFIKPLRAMQAMDPQHRDEAMHRSVIKIMSLTFVAVITTLLLTIAFAGLKMSGLAAIDNIINSLCIFLMNKEHDLWFKYLCCDGECGSKAVECCCSTKEIDE